MANPADLAWYAYREIWAIIPDRLRAAISLAAAIEDYAATPRLPKVQGTVAVLPVHGFISQRGGPFDDLFGGTSVDRMAATVDRAMADPQISAIVFDVDSPGGSVNGVQAAAEKIRGYRGTKPMVAVANSLMASAAYWLASQADQVVAAPGSDVGSIGVFRLHEDISEMAARAGVKVSFLAEPAAKVEGNPFEPLSDEAREFAMSQVRETYGEFVKAVAAGRGVTQSAVREGYGKGRTLKAGQARDAGMVDRVATLEQVLGGMMSTGKGRAKEMRSEAALVAIWQGEDTISRARLNAMTKRLRLNEILDKSGIAS